MIKTFVERWDKYKSDLEEYFKNTKQTEYSDYIEIVRALFKYVINKGMIRGYKFDIDNITVVDNGGYSGCEIFLIPLNSYCPDAEDYIVTNSYYGSCSGCDTILRISDYEEGLPNDKQVKQYMNLALNILQKCKWLY